MPDGLYAEEDEAEATRLTPASRAVSNTFCVPDMLTALVVGWSRTELGTDGRAARWMMWSTSATALCAFVAPQVALDEVHIVVLLLEVLSITGGEDVDHADRFASPGEFADDAGANQAPSVRDQVALAHPCTPLAASGSEYTADGVRLGSRADGMPPDLGASAGVSVSSQRGDRR